MKTAITAVVLLLFLASSAAYAAPETDVVTTKRILEQEQQSIGVASAVIRSRHELNQFLTANTAVPRGAACAPRPASRLDFSNEVQHAPLGRVFEDCNRA